MATFPTNGNDVLVGTTAGDTIDALGGNDSIDARTRPSGGADIDVVDGGAGTDTLIVDCSAETLSVQLGVGNLPTFTVRSTSGNFFVDAYAMERVKFTGGSGNDTIDMGERGGAVNGGGGVDHWLVDLSAIFANITFKLGTTTSIVAARLTSISAIERLTITTGAGNDTITGGDQADTINTGNGNDTINARTRPSGGVDIDVVDGEDGTDTLVVNASAETTAVQVFSGNSRTFSVRSTSANFYVDAYNMEKLIFTGGAGGDTLTGRQASDTIVTGAGSDAVDGAAGADVINTGNDIDFITGGRGADRITTGGGADDLFYFSVLDSSVFNKSVDTITDFRSGQDDIDLSGIDANNIAADGDQAFLLINGRAFSGVAGQLRSVAGIIEADVNGDKVADFRILLSNDARALAGDFVL